jgi:hypothetical protein
MRGGGFQSGREMRRAAAALLAALHLFLAVGTAHHAGVHLDEGLDWLPSEFHHHAYQITDLLDGVRLQALDPCFACNLGRATWRLPISPGAVPEGVIVAQKIAIAVPGAARCTDPSTRTTRGPPLA